MGTSQITELQVFAGGLNLQPASHLIQQHEARNLANANTRKVNLSPFLAPIMYQIATNNFVYNFKDKFKFYPLFRSNVLYNKVWYWSDQLNSGKVYEDGTELPLGIAPPINRLSVSAQAPTVGEGLTGNINYLYTYYDPISGSESPPSPPSITLDLTGNFSNQAIAIAGIVPSPDGYETRLYRIGGIITAYTAVVTIPSTTLSYVDQLAFSEIQAIILDTLRAYPPPKNILYLTQHQGRFYGAVGSKLYFSAPGKPDSWYVLDFVGFEDNIVGIASVSNGLLVMSDKKTWVITGISPIQFVKHTLSESEGCVGYASIATNEGTAVWLSRSGFMTSNGGSVVNISLDRIGRFKAMTPLGAAFLDKRYYMSFAGVLLPADDLFPAEDLYPGSVVNDSGIALPPGAIVIDFAQGAPSFTTLIDSSMGDMHVWRNELFHIRQYVPEQSNLVTEDDVFNIVTEDGLSNIVVSTETGANLMRTITGEELRELQYLSPVLTEGSIGMAKQYEKARITFSGELTLVILDEDSRVLATQQMASLKRTSVWVGIPVKSNRAYGIQFSIIGKCVVDSIMYNWTPKEAQ